MVENALLLYLQKVPSATMKYSDRKLGGKILRDINYHQIEQIVRGGNELKAAIGVIARKMPHRNIGELLDDWLDEDETVLMHAFYSKWDSVEYRVAAARKLIDMIGGWGEYGLKLKKCYL